ncbi:MAG: hypothetical protein KGJ86_15150 [Chloroflexota bacterium]|nr:hypothetical protein [Chloroflexota bacterium]
MIDGERLFELLGLPSADPDEIGEESYAHLLDFETSVDNAFLKGKIKRFTAKDPNSGAVVAHGYKRADVKALLRTAAAPAAADTQPQPQATA